MNCIFIVVSPGSTFLQKRKFALTVMAMKMMTYQVEVEALELHQLAASV